MYEFSLRAISAYFGGIPGGIAVTLWLSLLTIFFSTLIGMVGAVFRTSDVKALQVLGAVYVEVLRNIPLLVVIYLVYFGLAQIGLRVDNFNSALIALTLNAGSYMTEIFRGGLASIGRGQYEAARSQGMTTVQMYRLVIFPQVFRVIYPPLGNLFIGIVIGSSLASVIGVNDLAQWMHMAGNESFRYMETFLVAGIIYVVLCQSINVGRLLIGRWLLRSAPGRHRQ